jgi:hypothetical protein
MTISPAVVRRAAAASDRRAGRRSGSGSASPGGRCGGPSGCARTRGGNWTGRRSDQTAAWLAAGVDADHLRETAGALLRVVDLEGGRGAWHCYTLSWDVLVEKSASARSAPRAQVLRRPSVFREPGAGKRKGTITCPQRHRSGRHGVPGDQRTKNLTVDATKFRVRCQAL